PQVALAYQDAAVRFIKNEGNDAQLVTALRGRAHFEVNVGRTKEAERDLRDGFRLVKSSPQSADLEYRLHEVEGQFLLDHDPAGAASAFELALAQERGENDTYRARLCLQRATAELRANRVAEAERDLHDALELLRKEESAILAHRAPNDSEELWSPYFSRFQDAYRLLIARQFDAGRGEDAFAYAERARASEPLDLATKRGAASPSLRGMSVREIQARLPRGTFLIEYCVGDEATYA